MYIIVFLHVYMPCEFTGPNKNEINGRSNKKTTLLLRNVTNCNERKMESCSLKYSNYVLIYSLMWLLWIAVLSKNGVSCLMAAHNLYHCMIYLLQFTRMEENRWKGPIITETAPLSVVTLFALNLNGIGITLIFSATKQLTRLAIILCTYILLQTLRVTCPGLPSY